MRKAAVCHLSALRFKFKRICEDFQTTNVITNNQDNIGDSCIPQVHELLPETGNWNKYSDTLILKIVSCFELKTELVLNFEFTAQSLTMIHRDYIIAIEVEES